MKFMVSWTKRVYNASVFRKMPDDFTMSDVFAALFHRLAATTYLIYSTWAIMVIFNGVPSLVRQQGDQWTTIFAAFVLLLAAPACIGATFFPQMARTELFSGAGFVALMAVYFYLLIADIITRGGGFAGIMLLLSVVVMPLARTAIIVYFLLRQAKQRKAALAQSDSDGETA